MLLVGDDAADVGTTRLEGDEVDTAGRMVLGVGCFDAALGVGVFVFVPRAVAVLPTEGAIDLAVDAVEGAADRAVLTLATDALVCVETVEADVEAEVVRTRAAAGSTRETAFWVAGTFGGVGVAEAALLRAVTRLRTDEIVAVDGFLFRSLSPF